MITSLFHLTVLIVGLSVLLVFILILGIVWTEWLIRKGVFCSIACQIERLWFGWSSTYRKLRTGLNPRWWKKIIAKRNIQDALFPEDGAGSTIIINGNLTVVNKEDE